MLPAAFGHLDMLVLADGGFRTRAHGGPLAVDLTIRVSALGGALWTRLAGIDHIPVHLAAIEARRVVPGVRLDAVTISRDPRRLTAAGRWGLVPPERTDHG